MARRAASACAALAVALLLLLLVAVVAQADERALSTSSAGAPSAASLLRRAVQVPGDGDNDEQDQGTSAASASATTSADDGNDDEDDDEEGLDGALEDYDNDDSDDNATPAAKPASGSANGTNAQRQRPAAVPINLYSPNLAVRIPLGIVLTLGGLFWTFFGYRNFRVSMFIAGLLVGTMMMYVILANFRPMPDGYPVASQGGLFIGASLGVGIVFGVATVFLWPVGLFFIGTLGGFFFALFIEGWKTGGTVTSRAGQIALLVIPTFLLAVLPLIFERPSVIVATTITGSYITIMGIDAFVRTGFDVLIMSYMHARLPGFFYLVTPKVYGMLGGFMGFVLVGLIFQFLVNKEGVHWNRPPWRRKKRGKGYLNLMSVSPDQSDESDTKVAPTDGHLEEGEGEGETERAWDSVPGEEEEEKPLA